MVGADVECRSGIELVTIAGVDSLSDLVSIFNIVPIFYVISSK